MNEDRANNEARRRTTLSLVIPVDSSLTGHKQVSSTKKKSWKKKKETVVMAMRLLSEVYAILLVSFGILFPAAEALHDTWLNSYYNGVFLAYLYIIGTVFLIYLQLYVIPASNKKIEQDERNKLNEHFKISEQPEPMPFDTDKLSSKAKVNGGLVSDQMDKQKSSKSTRTKSVNSISSVALVSDEEHGQTLTWLNIERLKELFSSEGSSIYLRLGVLVFGIGNMIYIGLEIDYHFKVEEYCIGRFGWTFILRLIFTLVQTFFLLKHAKIEIIVHVNVSRWGFLHVIATNLCVWLSTLISEIVHAAHHSDDHIVLTTPNNYHDLSTSQDPVDCSNQRQLLSDSSPYLFPFVLEYSLIATGIIAIMASHLGHKNHQHLINKIQNVIKSNEVKTKKKGKRSNVVDNDTSDTSSMEYVGPMYTHHGTITLESSHKGMFVGILLLTGIILSMVLFLYEEKGSNIYDAQLSYLITDLCLHSIMLIATIMTIYSLNKLRVSPIPFSVDDILLLVSMSGSFMFEISILLSTAVFLQEEDVDGNQKTATVLALCCSFVAATQTLIQALLLITGLRRYTKVGDMINKPGREAVTFLIIANVTAWIFRTVQVKELEQGIQEQFYGTLAWLFILNINLPLLLFFRFHSSVCFADIWIEAYKPVDHNSVISQQPAVGIENDLSPTVYGDSFGTGFYISDEDSLRDINEDHSIHL